MLMQEILLCCGSKLVSLATQSFILSDVGGRSYKSPYLLCDVIGLPVPCDSFVVVVVAPDADHGHWITHIDGGTYINRRSGNQT